VHFLDHKDKQYLAQFGHAEYVRDFIATMTDRYFNDEVKHYLLPGRY
jgi:dGTPase